VIKLGVLADSHRSKTNLRLALEKMQDCDYIIHCGDHDSDMEDSGVPSSKLIVVSGNCDHCSFNPSDRIIEKEGVKLLITHGDGYGVKFSLMRLFLKAQEIGAKLVLYGHTHAQKLDEKDGITLLNPGALKNGAYAIVTIDDGIISSRMLQL